MKDYTDENRRLIKLLGGAKKMEHDFRNDKRAILDMPRLFKQAKHDRNGKEKKSGKKFKDMINKAGDCLATLKRQNNKWTEERK
jgi:hypothetical protein